VRELHIVAAIVRRDDDVLMVRQAGPGETPFWSIPGGRAEPGEFVTDALVRELAEETGISALELGPVAFIAQVDDRRGGWFATVWTWVVARWQGKVAPQDPDGFVLDAAWVPRPKAVERLEQISWQPLTARYLRGELGPDLLYLRRVHADGREELSSLPGGAGAPPDKVSS
jgi:8-oxo-dGTP diphosphatase